MVRGVESQQKGSGRNKENVIFFSPPPRAQKASVVVLKFLPLALIRLTSVCLPSTSRLSEAKAQRVFGCN